MIGLASCYPIANWTHGLKDDIDPGARLSREEFKNALLPPKTDEEKEAAPNNKGKEKEPSIPDFSDILTAPPPPDLGIDKLVSISVTEDVPIKDVLIELGRIADVDMEIDPAISGGIIFRVTNKPFRDVIKRIADLAGLRYHMDDGILRVERDIPYLKNYTVDFLNLNRSNTGSVTIDTKVLGGSASSGSSNSSSSSSSTSSSGSGGEGLSSGSSNAISSSYDGDLWTSVENTLQSILAFKPENLSRAIVAEAAAAAPTATAYTINRQAGVISVLANDKQQQNVKAYLDNVLRTSSAQVLIEAKIVEVTLDEQYRSGIDWGTISDKKSNLQFEGAFDAGIDSSVEAVTFGRLNKANTLANSVSLMDSFGVSRTLSSPRLHAMNNQQAVLTFAENNIYFTLEVEETEDNSVDGETTLTIDSTLNSVPIGVILTLQPSINLDSQEITMNIRPTLSRITGTVTDPGVDIIVARSEGGDVDVTSEIPIIEVRELDSVLKIQSGEIMVIGGLMREVNTNTDKGIPGAGRVPLLGNFFKGVSKLTEVVETVIFIKATIVPSASEVDAADQKIYKTFTRDPRPLAF